MSVEHSAVEDQNKESFFVPGGLVVGGQPVPHEGGNPILWQHLIWFLGHPEVYIVLLPAVSLVGEILATNARIPLFAYIVSVGALIGIGALCMIVWGHHMYESGMNPILGEVFVITTLAISFPNGGIIFPNESGKSGIAIPDCVCLTKAPSKI